MCECFQVFYPTLNVNGKLFVAMDQNGVSPPPLQGQLPACTMEKVKEESVSTVCVSQWKQWRSLQLSNTQTCELWISALHNSTLISWAKDTHTHTHTHSATAMASWAKATHTSTGMLLRCPLYAHTLTHTLIHTETQTHIHTHTHTQSIHTYQSLLYAASIPKAHFDFHLRLSSGPNLWVFYCYDRISQNQVWSCVLKSSEGQSNIKGQEWKNKSPAPSPASLSHR